MARYEIYPFSEADDPWPLSVLVLDEGEESFSFEEADRAFLDARHDREMEVTASIFDEKGKYVSFFAYEGKKGDVADQLRLAVKTASEKRGQRVFSRIDWILLKQGC